VATIDVNKGTMKKIIELYNSGLSIDKVAIQVDLKRSHVNTLLKNSGIPLRSKGARKGYFWGKQLNSKESL
jgi:hypothetical protein